MTEAQQNAPRKLLMVTTVPSTICAFLLPFARHWREKGWRVDAAAQGISNNQTCADSFDHVFDVQWSRNPFDLHNLAAAPRRIRALVETNRYDLVHVHTPIAAFLSRFALRRLRKTLGIRIIYTAHGFHFYQGGQPVKNAVFRLMEKLAGRWTDYLVVINREDEAAARRYRLLPSDRVRYMPGIGVDACHYSENSIDADRVYRVREELRLAPDESFFLMVAEFIPRKRHVDAITAFAELHRTRVHLVLAGDGPLMQKMKDKAAELGVADRVHFLGFRKDIPDFMKASVALLLPSKHEGLARCVMEAMCMAILVIGADVRGVRDLLTNEAGYLVKFGDINGYVRAMEQALDSPHETRERAWMGRQQIHAYDLGVIIRLHEELYKEVLNGRNS